LQTPPSARDALVAEARAELERAGSPRLHASLILLASGGSAFLVSMTLLSAGVHSMATRYALAALAGYLVFIVFIRLWIAWQRGSLDLTPDLDVFVPDSRSAADEFSSAFGGGRSGGAGAGASFGAVAAPQRLVAASPVRSSGSGAGFSLLDLFDGEDGWWIALALALALAALVALFYVVYAAPLLLAEVALDAAVMSGIYRRLRREDAQHWTSGVLRHTWIPALVIIGCAAGVGFAAQKIAPDARSIGGVVRSMMSR
jgi:hypothetical protein